MKIRKAAGIAAVSLAAVVALIWAAWLIAVPAGLITGKLDEGLANGPVRVEFEGLGKGLFYSINADVLRVFKAGDNREIVILEDLRAGLNIPSVFSLSPCIDLRASLSGGSIRGRACTDGSLILSAEDVNLSGLGIEKSVTGLRAGGRARLDINTVAGAGEARFQITGMSFLPYKYMGFPLPLDLLDKARGLVLIENAVATVESATLEGEGIYARAKGKVGGGRVDMKLELMPSEEVERSQPYFSMLQNYRVTPGLYEIPLSMPY
jgi:type II secretion system protein N